MGYRERITLACDMSESEIGKHLDVGNIAVRFAKGCAFDFREIIEPAYTNGSDGFQIVILHDVCRLKIVAVESMVKGKARIFHEADCSESEYLDKLFHAFNHFDTQRVVADMGTVGFTNHVVHS